MIQCPLCLTRYVANTLFCAECGTYLLEGKAFGTDPLEAVQVRWLGGGGDVQDGDIDSLHNGPLTIRLRIGKGDHAREVEVSLARPIRLGRTDPAHDIFPEVDLTDSLGRENSISRKHACIFQRGNVVEVEDLGSTNGTLLNNRRLAPYLPVSLKDGDQLQIGKLLIEVRVKS